jgi:hypothetical protein
MHQKMRLAVAVSKLLAGARVKSVFALKSRIVTASCFGSENGIFNHFLNQWHRFNRGSRKQITTAPVG